MKPTRTFVDGPYGQLHCRLASSTTTDARPVVCLHMSPKSSWLFADLLGPLSEQRTALAVDYPGHGESDLPPAQPHVTIEDYARCVWHAVDALCPGPVHFIGSHTGAMVAVEAATQRPGQTLGIVSHSAPILTPDETQTFADLYAPIPLDEKGTRFDELWKRVLKHRGPDMSLPLCAESFAENLRSGDAYEWGHRAAFAYAATYQTRLASLDHTIMLLNVNDDMREHTRRADSLLRNGRRVERMAWGHGFFSVHAGDVASLCNDFFREVESQP
ncbi:MAG: alpha/beta hydrolase [Gammaproteobacteria bacterium]